MSTGSTVLVEASPYDKVWGVGMKALNPAIKNPQKWRGLNLLGFSLTKTREAIKSENQAS